MLFYGDRVRQEPTRQAVDRLKALLAAADAGAPGLDRHAALVTAFVAASQLFQGVADAEMAATGQDDVTPAQHAGMALLLSLARSIGSSWRGGGGSSDDSVAALRHWRALRLPDEIHGKTAEGYAHYAIYPEAYLEAATARHWTRPPRVLGLRSIGAGLAAMVAVGAGARLEPLTLRPSGPPFARQLRLSDRLRSEILSGDAPFAVVDEGPGLSGSSFGAVGDLLDAAGVARDRVTYFPSHAGQPGPHAGPVHRERWRQAQRVVADFDAAALGEGAPGRRLDRWVADLVGPIIAPRRDLSGGRWRAVRGVAAPATPSLERHKFLYRSPSGDWLVKFAGLGEHGATKARRAGLLAAAGFSPSVAGLRHGFLIETWLGDGRPLEPARHERRRLLDRLARYLAFRARQFPATPRDGASSADLLEMARVNSAEALGAEAGAAVIARLESLSRTVRKGRPIAVDGRLHAWEWIELADGRLLKTDAVDHADGHDLIGCQDIAWDLAGARIELELSDDETAWLARAVERLDGGETPPARLALHGALYAAFQLGLWSVGQDDDGENQRRIAAHTRRYRHALLAFAGQSAPEAGPDLAAKPARPNSSNPGDRDGCSIGAA
jgi:hypothetical protein